MNTTPPSVYILAGDVSFNKGDRGNLISQIDLIKSRYPSADITLCSMKPEQDAKLYDARVIKRSPWISRDQWRYMRQADVIVWGGGGLVTDHGCRTLIPYWMTLIFVAKFILRTPVMAWSHGVVLRTKIGRALARILYRWVDVIAVRDRCSFDAIKELDAALNPVMTADVAVLMSHDDHLDVDEPSLPRPLKDREMIIGIAPTFWHIYNAPNHVLPYMFRKKIGLRTRYDRKLLQDYVRGLTLLTDEVIRVFDCSVLLLPRYAHPDWNDVGHLRDIASNVSDPGRVMVLDEDAYGPRAYPLIIKRLSCSITVPLHEAIFAAVTDTPFIHLHYEEKGRCFMEELHANDRSMSWTTLLDERNIPDIVETAGRTLDDWQKIQTVQRERLNILRKRAAINADLLTELLDGTSSDHVR